jgi:hypothetical protein
MHHIQILSIEAARWAIKCSPNLKVSNIATREVDEKVLSVFGEGILRTASNKRSALKALGSKSIKPSKKLLSYGQSSKKCLVSSPTTW